MVARTATKEINLEPIKFKAVPRLLDHIGVAMYSKFNKAISELVVNGYDADAKRVDIAIKYDKVIIKDNGVGMDENSIRNIYMELGGDKKRAATDRTLIFKRLPIGNKGIGKLAALGVAKKFSVVTKKKGGLCFKYTIDRDDLEKKGTLEDGFIDLENYKCNDIKDHGTIIELTKILSHVKIDEKELRGYLAREVPQDENFQIYVNGEKCEIIDIPGKKFNVEINNKECGKIEGFIIVAKNSFSNIIKPGVLTTVRGRVVGEPNLFDVNKGGHKYSHANYITGRIEVSGFDPENHRDKIPVIKTDREGFNANHPKYIAYNEEMTRLLIKICKQEEKEHYEKKRLKKELHAKNVIPNVIDDVTKSAGKAVPTKTEHKKEDREIKVTLSPVGIRDPKVKLELKSLKGLGAIKLDNKEYKLTMRPVGENDVECRIDDDISVVNINVDHPAYLQAVEEKNVETAVFRAIATAYACKVSRTAEEMYEKIDRLIRMHIVATQERDSKKIRKK